MKVLMINAVCGSGSTGRIVSDLWKILKEEGHEAKIAYGVGNGSRVDESDLICFNDKVGYYRHNIAAKLTDKTGLYSTKQTRYLVNEIKKYNPDIIHLHNLHGYYINYKTLFEYLAELQKPIIWTLHDCWPFTGHCVHFSLAQCDQWKTHCVDCKLLKDYPKCYFKGDVRNNFEIKKKTFTSIKDMVVVTPSQWLADLTKQSFLGKYTVEVINNGIDLDIFKPVSSDFRKKHNIVNKTMVLAVSNIWNWRKGYHDVLLLADNLGEGYQVVMVGLTAQQIKSLPANIIAIERTNSIDELAKIYSAADVFINTTYEDNFPTVNLEALACGTPIVTYNTGGSVEAADSSCGIVVEQGNLNELITAIDTAKNMKSESAFRRAKLFERTNRYEDYIRLYKRMIFQEM